jgi:hypothetical protein
MSHISAFIVTDPLVDALFEVAQDDLRWCRGGWMQKGGIATRTAVSLGGRLTPAHIVNFVRLLGREFNATESPHSITVRIGRLVPFDAAVEKFHVQSLMPRVHAVVGHEPLEGRDQWYVQDTFVQRFQYSVNPYRLRAPLNIEPESPAFEVRRCDRRCPILCVNSADHSVVLHV